MSQRPSTARLSVGPRRLPERSRHPSGRPGLALERVLQVGMAAAEQHPQTGRQGGRDDTPVICTQDERRRGARTNPHSILAFRHRLVEPRLHAMRQFTRVRRNPPLELAHELQKCGTDRGLPGIAR
jgi:hypothetical protein